jgi:hypothetical protein
MRAKLSYVTGRQVGIATEEANLMARLRDDPGEIEEMLDMRTP